MSTVLEPDVLESIPPLSHVNGRIYTPDDLLQMPEEGRFELVDGQLVERNMGSESSQVTGRVFLRIGTFVEVNAAGVVFPSDCGYQIYPRRPKLVRFPDTSFVRTGRLPSNVAPKGHMRIVPDFVLEVVSPNDLACEVEAKIEEYLSVAVPLIWVVYPGSRSVYVYGAGKSVARLGVGDTLTADDVLPGFSCPVADIFPAHVETSQDQPQASS